MHVAIIHARYARALLSGRKRIESRLYRTRRVPLDRIRSGERVVFKVSSGPILGVARVLRVEQYAGLRPEDVDALRARYNGQIGAPAGYWREKRGASFGVLIWVGRLRAAPPVRVPRQHGSGWVILPRESVGA